MAIIGVSRAAIPNSTTGKNEDWRQRYWRASFRGVEFHMDTQGKSGGRRPVPHNFPKRNDGYTEDMGRRLKRFAVTGYVIGKDFRSRRDALKSALDEDGPGMLQLPTDTKPVRVIVEVWTCNERRERGNIAEFEMMFYEAGALDTFGKTNAEDTQGNAQTSADEAAKTNAVDGDNATGSEPSSTTPLPPPRPQTLLSETAPLPPTRPTDLGMPSSFQLPPTRPVV
jgi:prophage DNA circulation protein